MARMSNRVELVKLLVYDDGSMEIKGRFFPANFSYEMPGPFEVEVTSFGDSSRKLSPVAASTPINATLELLVETIVRVVGGDGITINEDEVAVIEEPTVEAVPEAEEEDPWAQRIQERLERGSKETDGLSQVEEEFPST